MLYLVDGVSVFFVLSGFLIGNIIIKKFIVKPVHSKTLSSFWINRWMRTLPAYFCILIAVFVLRILVDGVYPVISDIKFVFFLQNFNWKFVSFFVESWSLSIEEWFYLLVPLALIVAIKTFKIEGRKAILLVIISLIIGVFFIRLFKYGRLEVEQRTDPYFWQYVFRQQVVTRLDSIMFGVLGAYISYFCTAFWHKVKYIALFIGLGLILLKLFFSNFFMENPIL